MAELTRGRSLGQQFDEPAGGGVVADFGQSLHHGKLYPFLVVHGLHQHAHGFGKSQIA